MSSTLPLELAAQSSTLKRPVIVLGEGHDPRIIMGAVQAVTKGVANIILVGDTTQVQAALTATDTALSEHLTHADPITFPNRHHFIDTLVDLRGHKGMTAEKASQAINDPLVFAALMVKTGLADGTVNGAVATTSDVVRAALQVIGKAAGIKTVSSCFLMYPPNARAMVYSDCGLVIDPDEEELADIALSAAQSCKALLRQEPKIAMLSFSTMGSARHAKVSKVVRATEIVKERDPSLDIDGELQFDAAFVPSVGASKAPNSTIAGQANVMVFPNLDAGNIGYKITQRLGGAIALGPILQGLSKPANDLSRGCDANDVAQMIAVTVLQARQNNEMH